MNLSNSIKIQLTVLLVLLNSMILAALVSPSAVGNFISEIDAARYQCIDCYEPEAEADAELEQDLIL